MPPRASEHSEHDILVIGISVSISITIVAIVVIITTYQGTTQTCQELYAASRVTLKVHASAFVSAAHTVRS